MTVSYAVRVEEDIRDQAAAVARSYGLDLASATRAFWTQMARTREIPLNFTREDVTREDREEPNDESLESIAEASAMMASGAPSRFGDAEDMFVSLGIRPC